MVPLLSFRARRRSGFIVGSLGVAMIFAIYAIWVRNDLKGGHIRKDLFNPYYRVAIG